MKAKNALVVIDLQNWSVNDKTRDIPEKVANFIDKNKNNFDFVLFTKAHNTKNFSLYKYRGVKEGMRGRLLEMRPEIRRFLTRNNVFSKTTYSAFKSKKFSDFLKKNNIKELYLCGINTDKCVLATAYEAFDLGYEIRIIDDLIGSTAKKAKHNAGLLMLKGLASKRPMT